MFPGRMAAVVKGLKDSKKVKKKDLLESELKLLKVQKTTRFKDKDLWEIDKKIMRYRSYPFAFWILGFGFLGGALLVVTLLYEDFIQFKKLWHEYLLVAMMVVLGIMFLTAGKIKSVIFDKNTKQVIIRKRTITCHCKTITKYNMKDMYDVRAVWRGLQSNSTNTLHYSIILDFDVDLMLKRQQKEKSRAGQTSTQETGDEDENAYLTSDAEQEWVTYSISDKQYEEFLQNQEKLDEIDESKTEETQEKTTDEKIVDQLQIKKEQHYTWNKLFYSCVPMWNHQVKKGRKFEVKILETKDKHAIQKKVIMIRRFLGMPVDDCDIKIHDERQKRNINKDFPQKSNKENLKKRDNTKEKEKEKEKSK